jgi:hypothetical protein
MADMRKIVELHRRWWDRSNQEVLVANYAPLPTPCGGLDVEVPPGEMHGRKLRNAQAAHAYLQDALFVATADFSTALRPAVLGAGFKCDGHTSWSVPVAENVRELRVQPFDPHHPIYEAYLDRLAPLLENWSWDTYVPCTMGVMGPMDTLSAMLGPEKLSLELMDHPGEVRRHAADAARALVEMMEYELALFRTAGLTDGMPSRFAMWLPDDGGLFAEDFGALVGERHYREFFSEPDATVLGALPASLYHVHSAGAGCMPAILDTPGVTALELSNDPNGPPLDDYLATARAIQQAGHPLQLSNWQKPLSRAQMERFIRELDPRGLIVRFEADSVEESRELTLWLKRLSRERLAQLT